MPMEIALTVAVDYSLASDATTAPTHVSILNVAPVH